MVEAANQYDKQPPDEKHINHISVYTVQNMLEGRELMNCLDWPENDESVRNAKSIN